MGGGQIRVPLTTIEQACQLRTALTYDDEAIHRDLPDFVGFMLATGCRIGEALTLTWDAIDLEAGTVEIRGSKTAAALCEAARLVPRDAARQT
jgi:integrase